MVHSASEENQEKEDIEVHYEDEKEGADEEEIDHGS